MNGTNERADDPSKIEEDINRTRERLGETVEELEYRLSPGQFLDQALGMARREGGEFAGNLGRSVRNNPIPVLLTSVGIAWMMASSNERYPSSSAYDTDHESLGSKARAARDKARAARDRTAEAGRRLKESAGQAGDRMRSSAYRVRNSFAGLMQDQPLTVGALGLALGAALGAALPTTEAEEAAVSGNGGSRSSGDTLTTM